MGAYKYIEEIWKRKQCDVLRYLMRIRAWQYRQQTKVCRCTRPTRHDKAHKLGAPRRPDTPFPSTGGADSSDAPPRPAPREGRRTTTAARELRATPRGRGPTDGRASSLRLRPPRSSGRPRPPRSRPRRPDPVVVP